ncbi:MAG: cobalamin-dependent protein [Pseudomonadota bacterium]
MKIVSKVRGVLINVTHQEMHSPGMLQIYLYLKSKGFDVEYADINSDPDTVKSLKRRLKKSPEYFQWIGLHADYQTKQQVRRFVTTLRSWNYHGHVSVGGVFPTMHPAEYFDGIEIDTVVLGAGELVVKNLLSLIERNEVWTKLPGIAWTKNGRLRTNPNIFKPVLWDEIQEDPGLVSIHRNRKSVYINSSCIRSCPGTCSWCPDRFADRAAQKDKSGFHPRRVNYKPLERLKREIVSTVIEFNDAYDEADKDTNGGGSIFFYILDNDAFSTPELVERNVRLAEWINGELNQIMGHFDFRWLLWGTARSILSLPDNYLNVLKSSNLTFLVGIESFSTSQLKRLGKMSTREENIAVCERLGLNAGILMIIWDPWISPEEMFESWSTYQTILSCPKPPDYENINKFLVLIPGTPMYKRFMQSGKKYRKDRFGAIASYELLDPVSRRLQSILSQFVHYWTQLRGSQQSLCSDEVHPLSSQFKALHLNKCTFCEIGKRKDVYLRFQEAILHIIKLAMNEERGWSDRAKEFAREEIRKLKNDIASFTIREQSLYSLSIDHAKHGSKRFNKL